MIRPERGLIRLLIKLGIKSAGPYKRRISILRMRRITKIDPDDAA